MGYGNSVENRKLTTFTNSLLCWFLLCNNLKISTALDNKSLFFFMDLGVTVALLGWAQVNSMRLLIFPWVFTYTGPVLLMTGHLRGRG